ncbi:MAG: bis(5'-nucleosyl)-tetraphosphatase (symmetrical) YqeK [Solibacillus sp.]
MERQQLLAVIKGRMTEKRYIHTIGVMETAIQLAQHYGEDPKMAETAAILHDIAKFADVNWMKDVVNEQKLDARLLDWDAEILHGPVGAWIAETEFGIVQEEILNAIRYHTTGRVHMTPFEKIIYVADMIEPNRKFAGVERLRQLAKVDLQEAFIACVTHTLSFLVETHQAIYPLSIECFNSIVREEQQK